jgi:hypothetical protein
MLHVVTLVGKALADEPEEVCTRTKIQQMGALQVW